MIQIRINTNTVRKTIATDPNNTVRTVLTANEVHYENAPIYLDGAPLSAGDYNKSFTELGITDRCVMTSVVKTENA